MKESYIGRSLRRLEDTRFLTRAAMSMTSPGQLHSIELRSQPGFAQVGEIECPENIIHERQSENAD